MAEPHKVNFRDEDSLGNPTGSFNPRVSVHGNDPAKVVPGSITLAVYPDGGYDVSNIVGLFDHIEGMIIGSAGGYTFEFDKANNKVKAYSTPGTEVVASTNLAALTVPFIAVGR